MEIKKKMGGRSRLLKKDHLQLCLMALPAVLVIFVVNYIPMAGVLIAFKDIDLSKGFWGSDWVGFKNFQFLFATDDAARITFNTVFMNLLFMIVGLVVSVGFALLLNEVRSRRAVKALQTTYFFPYFVSWVVAGFVVYAFLNVQYGMVNGVLNGMGGRNSQLVFRTAALAVDFAACMVVEVYRVLQHYLLCGNHGNRHTIL